MRLKYTATQGEFCRWPAIGRKLESCVFIRGEFLGAEVGEFHQGVAVARVNDKSQRVTTSKEAGEYGQRFMVSTWPGC